MGLLLASLLGMALLGTVAFDWFDDESDGSPPDETTPPEETGRDLDFDGSDPLVGTEGDDTIPGEQDDALAPGAINLLGGDDTGIIELDDVITVSGGAGDDSLTATGVLNTLDGGAGNDTLTGDDSNRLIGGEGADVLNFVHGSFDQGENGIADGGDGDDTINLRTDALISEEDLLNVGGVDVTGGDGADEINIVYELNAFDSDLTPADSTVSQGFVTVSDFVPAEDLLLIEVERGEGATDDRDVSVDLDQTEDNGTYTSLITLTFEQTDDMAEATNILTVLSSAPFTLDDIQLVLAPERAAVG